MTREPFPVSISSVSMRVSLLFSLFVIRLGKEGISV